MTKVKDILPLMKCNDALLIKDEDEEICLLRKDFILGSLSDKILDMAVVEIENDETVLDTIIIYVTDKEETETCGKKER